jgi:hypothetical protein
MSINRLSVPVGGFVKPGAAYTRYMITGSIVETQSLIEPSVNVNGVNVTAIMVSMARGSADIEMGNDNDGWRSIFFTENRLNSDAGLGDSLQNVAIPPGFGLRVTGWASTTEVNVSVWYDVL